MSALSRPEMTAWRSDVEEARDALAGLDVTGEVDRARAEVVEWREVRSFSAFFLPLPLVVQDVPSLEGGWIDGSVERELSDRHETVGFDAAGRPVIHLLGGLGEWDRAKHLWRWAHDGSFVEIELFGSGPHVRKARVEDGELRTVTTASRYSSMQLARLEWEDGRCVRVDGATGFALAFACRLDVGPGGEQMVLRAAEPYDDDLVAERDLGESLELLGGTLERAAALVPDGLSFDGRVSTPETWPGVEAAEALVEPLAEALTTAFADAVVEHSLPSPPFFLSIATGRGGDGHSWPPYGLLASTLWREGRRRASRQDGAALTSLWQGVKTGEVQRVEIVDRLDADVLRGFRVFATAFSVSTPLADHRAAAPVADRIGERFATLLAQAGLQRVADPFVAFVGLGDPYHRMAYDGSEQREVLRARMAYGSEHVDRFLASVKAQPKRRRPTKALLRRAHEDAGALRELVEHFGLEAHADRILAAARPAVELRAVPVTSTTRSRLGGPAVLPPGTPWPRTEGGTPLTFLAGVDLSEVTAAGLPADGWLLFFAALDPDAGGLVDDADGSDGSPVRVLRIAPGESPVDATSPPELGDLMLGELQHRGVDPVARLTLPDGYDAASELGLDVHEALAYEELIERFDGGELPMEAHWLGGAVTGAQGHPHEPGSELLLHLGPDDDLGFQYLDGGTIQFRITREALAAEDWRAVEAIAESS